MVYLTHGTLLHRVYVPKKKLQSLNNYGLLVLKKNLGSYQKERFKDPKKVTLKHMQHGSRRLEEERSLDSKEEMKEEDLPLKEREICQNFNAIIVTNLVPIDTIALKG